MVMNAELDRLRAEVASLKEERDKLRRKIFTNTNGEFTLENRTFSIEGFDFILDNNFDFDAGLKVSGDFGSDEKRHDYMQMICNALNSHCTLTQQLAAANGRVERQAQVITEALHELDSSAVDWDSPILRASQLLQAEVDAALSNLNEDRDKSDV
jgi:hypothetical protein